MSLFAHQHAHQGVNIVLVHGAWADGSSWSSVIERLQKEGNTITAVQMALTSFADDVAQVRRVLSAQSGPTILVAHSYGGAVITALGKDAPNVVGLVYVAAFVPDQGESLKGLITGGPQPAGGAAFRPDEWGLIWLDREGFSQYFAPDVNQAQARVLAAVQKPIAASTLLTEDTFGEPVWKTLPAWYLVTEQDQMIPPDAQRFMAQRAGATVASIASSHVPMISHSNTVADLILNVAKAIEPAAK
ncbi:alpha/beta hydrolase [Dictyobacter sp. S3.2.2.5]|uniref:Alpha/beta hydrolase n=1 Tax=Dictyobacter halimunensis TaxID=3026934 RepID=A0ABQ6FNH4_9CHLR|nr:alpha/beta hydrolase [Dictyobacter sp. S3.2.2.5]